MITNTSKTVQNLTNVEQGVNFTLEGEIYKKTKNIKYTPKNTLLKNPKIQRKDYMNTKEILN